MTGRLNTSIICMNTSSIRCGSAPAATSLRLPRVSRRKYAAPRWDASSFRPERLGERQHEYSTAREAMPGDGRRAGDRPGIGGATAVAFAREGAGVVATDINQSALRNLQSECELVEVRVLDVTVPSAIDECVTAIGPLDVLFNCAGYVHQGSILECSDADWGRSFQINV